MNNLGLEFISALIPSGIYLVGWVIALIFVRRMINNGGTRAEHLLLIGIWIMVAKSIIDIIFKAIDGSITQWLFTRTQNEGDLGLYNTATSTSRSIVGLIGIVYLIYAFWIKFQGRNKNYS